VITMAGNVGNKDKIIKVLLVDDSPIAIRQLEKMLSLAQDIEVMGIARNGAEALDILSRQKPDVICTDLHMPVMNGLELTRRVVADYRLPILVISVSVDAGSDNVFKLLEAGALDIFEKPQITSDAEMKTQAYALISKLRILSGVTVFGKFSGTQPAADERKWAGYDVAINPLLRIILIGASTGGPQALLEILSSFPKDFPLPVVCVQHISDGFMAGLIDWLTSQCRMPVRQAQEGELPAKGTIYFPREKMHIKFDDNGRFAFSRESLNEKHVPSINVLMKTGARVYGKGAMGVLLTGMGSDGAEGLKEIAAAGGATLAQDEESCIIFGMPRVAIEMGAAQHVVPLKSISEYICRMTTAAE
jgi:two-component system, chemotaxis family, protein-glutamate methylesterase/glutaminase